MSIKNWGKIIQPNPTVSIYNFSYYCGVISVEVIQRGLNLIVEVAFDVRGNQSLGAIQDPHMSTLLVGALRLRRIAAAINDRDARRITGTLSYEIDITQCENLNVEPVHFIYGEGGYSKARLLTPYCGAMNWHRRQHALMFAYMIGLQNLKQFSESSHREIEYFHLMGLSIAAHQVLANMDLYRIIVSWL